MYFIQLLEGSSRIYSVEAEKDDTVLERSIIVGWYQMNLDILLKEMAAGEGLHLEFKEAINRLPVSLFDTVCAFLNTDGGTIILGVTDDGTVTGVSTDDVASLKSDIASLSNNAQKIDPPYLLFPHEYEINGKTIIVIQVPLSSQIHKHKEKIFLRSEDGDYHVKGTHQLAGLLNRKLGLFTEQKAIPYLTIDELRMELFDKARRLMLSYNSHHPWASLSNDELLKHGGFYTHDSHSGKKVLTLAAILLFGTDEAINQVVPGYKFDCLLRRVNTERYDDRLIIRTNLIDAYDHMMGFVEKHLNDPFYLEGDMRISLRDKIFREAISNIVAHREYLNASPARLIIYKDRVILENPSVQHHFEEITPENVKPFPKNPSICKFMIQLGRFDELGSGVLNINRYLPLYAHGAKPTFIESRHGFILTLPLAGIRENVKTDTVTGDVKSEIGTKSALSRHQVEILRNCMKEKAIGDLMKIAKRADRTKFRKQVLNPLLNAHLIEMTFPDKPRSSKQKYRLTEAGKKFLKGEIV